MNNDEIAKFLNGTTTKAKSALDSVHITGQQARTAGAMGQVGGGAGAITGSLIGTGIGLATKHPAQGAGIGAAIGGAAGSSGGAALGLYAGRTRKKKAPKVPAEAKQSDYALAKAFDAHRTGRDAMVAGGSVGTAAGASAGLHALNGLRAKKVVQAGADATEHSANQIFKPGLSLSQRLSHGLKAIDEGKKVAGAGETALASRAAMHTNLKVAGAGAALAGAGALLHAGTKPKTALAKSFEEAKHKRGDGGKFVGVGALTAGGITGATGAVMSLAGHNSAKSFGRRAEEAAATANHERALSNAVKDPQQKIDYLRRSIGARSSAIAMKGSEGGALALREAGGRTALAGGAIMGAGLGAAALMHHHELKKSFEESKHRRGHGGQFVATSSGAFLAAGGAGVTGHQAARHARTSSQKGEQGRFWREGAGEFGQDASQASKLARANINFAESAASSPDTAHRKGWYLAQSKGWSLRAKKFAENAQTEGKRSRALLGEAASAKRAALGHGGVATGLGLTAVGLGAAAAHHELKKSFSHPTDEAQHHLAQAGLGVAAAADVAGASAAFKESKRAVKPALEGLSAAKKIKAVAGYTKEKAAFPIVAGGIGATVLAEHVMHNQQKTKPALPRPGQ